MRAQEVLLPMRKFAALDRLSPIPLYFQLSQIFEQAIHDGELAPGDRMENEIAISERIKLSRPTVRRAIEELVNKGFLVRRRGIGTQVVHGQVTRGLELTSLHEDLARAGKTPTTKILGMRHLEADSVVAEHLGIKAGDGVIYLHRLRGIGKTPMAIMENWLPMSFSRISMADLQEYGLYECMRNEGATIQVAKQTIGARRATTEESELLALEHHAPVLAMTRTAYDNSGKAVEFGVHSYRTDLYSFEFTLVER